MSAWARAAVLAAVLLVAGCDSRKPPPTAPPQATAAPVAPKAPVEAAQPHSDDGEDAPWTEWTTLEDPETKTYRVDPFTLETAKAKTIAGEAYAVLTISTPGADEPLRLKGPTTGKGGSSVHAEFGVFRLDKRNPDPQLLIRFFAYGAHCCYAYRLVDRRGGRWSVHILGDWDVAGAPEPVDVDGDGTFELVGGDQGFLYAFEGYAGSPPPAAIWRVEDGEMVDVSTDRRYRRVYEKAVAENETGAAHSAHPETACGTPQHWLGWIGWTTPGRLWSASSPSSRSTRTTAGTTASFALAAGSCT